MLEPLTPYADAAQAGRVVVATRRWVDRAVIGLNLCPFAKAAQTRGLVHYTATAATTRAELLAELAQELVQLDHADPRQLETTLLVHPEVLTDFLEYNEFLDDAERVVAELGLEGVLQVASFHPQYQFAGTAADDVTNCTNRSPYPTLHLLREESIDLAVEAFPDAEAIYGANIETLRKLGPDGWQRLVGDE
jgi:uncharacterized protein